MHAEPTMRRCLSALFSLASLACVAADRPEALEIRPREVTLSGPAASQRLVVLGVYGGGSVRDLTPEANLEPASPLVRLNERGHLAPSEDGEGEVIVRAAGAEARVRV